MSSLRFIKFLLNACLCVLKLPILIITQDQLVLENEEIRAHFQNNGLLENIFKKRENSSVPVKISFGMYKPTNRQSGAYLLKPILPSEWKVYTKFQL